MYLSLYRRYRPQYFNEIIGQDAAVKLITRGIHKNNISHAYLFSGPRGSGKTSLARILARAVNCLDPQVTQEPCGKCRNCISIQQGDNLDVVEIDGASNNGVDEVRELKSHVNLSPFSSKMKIYIIDEVHMLSISAFNALLKTLEEPPEYVIFILATTEPHKVPSTIRSRCQHIPFQRIPERAIQAQLAMVSEKEGFSIEERAAREITRHSDGSLRDALSFLEQSVTLEEGEVTLEGISRILGGASYPNMEKLFRQSRHSPDRCLSLLQDYFSRGASPLHVLEYLFLISRNLWITKRWGLSVIEPLDFPEEEIHFLSEESSYWDEAGLLALMEFSVSTIPQTRYGMRSDLLSGIITSMIVKAIKENKADRPQDPQVYCAAVLKEDQQNQSLNHQEVEGTIGEEDPDPQGSEAEDPVTDQLHFKELLQRLRENDVQIFTALIHARISLEEEKLVADFPLNTGAAFEIISTSGNAFSLQRTVAEVFHRDLGIFIRCGEREKYLTSTVESSDITDLATEEPTSIQQANLFNSPVGEVAGGPSTENKDQAETANSSGGFQETDPVPTVHMSHLLEDIISVTKGELLILDNCEPSEEILHEDPEFDQEEG